MWVNKFKPIPGAGINLPITATSANTAIISGGRDILLTNTGNNTAWVEVGTTSSVAAARNTGMVLLPSHTQILHAYGSSFVAGICNTGVVTTLHIVPGEGS